MRSERESQHAEVLLVDDDPSVRTSLARVLRRASLAVTEAEDGQAALEKVAARDFDVVVCDVNMPRMDGIEVLMAIQTVRPKLPVVMISGGGRVPKEVLLDSASALGAVTVIDKPVSPERLTSAIETVLGEDEQSREHGNES